MAIIARKSEIHISNTNAIVLTCSEYMRGWQARADFFFANETDWEQQHMRKRDDSKENQHSEARDAATGTKPRKHKRHGGTGKSDKVNVRVLLGITVGLIAIAAVLMWLTSTDFRPFDAVTATANDGYRIYEDEVNAEIAERRAVLGLKGDGNWSEWLASQGYKDVRDVRKDVIDDMMRRHAMQSECERLGIMPSDDEINAEVSNYKGTSGLDGADWKKMLIDSGYDTKTYRRQIATHLMTQRLKDKLTSDDADGSLSSDSVIDYVSGMGDYFKHARKITCIVMRSDERDKMEEIAKDVKDDPKSFDGYRSKYGETNLLDGWDVLNDMSSSMVESLGQLKRGETSDVIELDSSSSPLLVIARIDDAYDTDKTITSLDQMPSDLVQAIKDNLADTGRINAVTSHINDVIAKLDVKVNDTDVKKLPYYVEVSASDSTDAGDGTTDAAGDTTTLDGTTYVTQNDASGVSTSETDATTGSDGNTHGTADSNQSSDSATTD